MRRWLFGVNVKPLGRRGGAWCEGQRRGMAHHVATRVKPVSGAANFIGAKAQGRKQRKGAQGLQKRSGDGGQTGNTLRHFSLVRWSYLCANFRLDAVSTIWRATGFSIRRENAHYFGRFVSDRFDRLRGDVCATSTQPSASTPDGRMRRGQHSSMHNYRGT